MNKAQIVWRVRTYNWTIVVIAATVAQAAAKATKVLKSKYESPNPTIDSIERIGEVEE